MAAVRGFHAHVYFEEASFERARALCEQARDRFPVRMGRMHRKPVGPHPCWSCQLAFEPQTFGDIIPWLALHRDGLVVFVHPETGDEVADHVAHAIWMGAVKELDLSALE